MFASVGNQRLCPLKELGEPFTEYTYEAMKVFALKEKHWKLNKALNCWQFYMIFDGIIFKVFICCNFRVHTSTFGAESG